MAYQAWGPGEDIRVSAVPAYAFGIKITKMNVVWMTIK